MDDDFVYLRNSTLALVDVAIRAQLEKVLYFICNSHVLLLSGLVTLQWLQMVREDKTDIPFCTSSIGITSKPTRGKVSSMKDAVMQLATATFNDRNCHEKRGLLASPLSKPEFKPPITEKK